MNVKLPSGELRINGKKVKTEKTIPVVNPTTEEVIGEIASATEKDVNMAVEAAGEAFKTWKILPLERRLSYLKKFRNLMLEKMNETAYIDAIESGHPFLVGLTEAFVGSATAKYYERFAKEFLKEERLPSPFPFKLMYQMRKSYKVYEPMGVIGVITPWNTPVILSLNHIIPALAAGNTVVFKPSKYTTFVSLKLYEIFEEAGLPAGVLNVVTGSGAETGTYLTRSKIQKISFTGSSITAPKILENCAKNLTPTTLELGGCDAMIILKDADLDDAASAAVYGSFWNSGQICVASKRILVDKNIKEDFIRKVLARVNKLKMGDPLEKGTDVGPLVTRGQVDNTEAFVKDAVARGAKIVSGGKRREGKGYFFEPTVLTNIDMSMLITYEERFGPVMSIYEFEGEEEAIAMANYPEYGLSSSIWTRNIKKAKEIQRRIVSGFATINSTSDFALYSPYGGVKKSGFGKVHGREGLLEVTYHKTIDVVERKLPMATPYWFPWTAVSCENMINFARIFFKDGLKGKLSMLGRFLKGTMAHEKEYKEFIKE